MSDISKYDYEHAQKVWKEFKLRNLGEYHDLYLKTDVLLLSNVFETFRNDCLDYYELGPEHFYTSPGLAWEACLKKTGVRLELLTDPDMLLCLKKVFMVVSPRLFTDMRKPITSTWVITKE